MSPSPVSFEPRAFPVSLSGTGERENVVAIALRSEPSGELEDCGTGANLAFEGLAEGFSDDEDEDFGMESRTLDLYTFHDGLPESELLRRWGCPQAR